MVSAPVKVETAPVSSVQVLLAESACKSEISKYDWSIASVPDKSRALKIAMNVSHFESGGKAASLNPDASTGDYSVGCFSVNLLGDANLNAKYRDAKIYGYQGAKTVAELEPWLKNPANNVAVAHHMQQGSGWGPWSATTCSVRGEAGKKMNCF